MTRFAGDRFVYVFAANRTLASGAGQTLEVFADAACTTLAAITDLGGVPIPQSRLTVGADSQLPLFLDPSDRTTLWVRRLNVTGPGTEIVAVPQDLTAALVADEIAGDVAAYLADNPPSVEPSTDAGNLLDLGTDGRLRLTATALPPVIVDHGALTGRDDDDHPQYLTVARGDTRYYVKAQADLALGGKADVTHAHALADVTGLVDALGGKASTTHTHAISDTTGLQGALNAKADTSHSHAISTVTGLQAALDGKAASVHTHAIGQVTSLQATLDGKAPVSHAHEIGHVTGLQAALDSKQVAGDYATATALSNGLATRAPLAHGHSEYIKTVNTIPPDANGNVTIVAHDGGDASVTDHGELTGLADDDHPQYLNNVRGDARYYLRAEVDTVLATKASMADPRFTDARTPLAHTHAVADVTGLQAALDGKVATSDARLTDSRTPTAHTHPSTQITDFAEAVRDTMGVALVATGLVSVTVNDAADTLTIATTATANATDAQLRDRSTHTGAQAISTITGLQAALDGKAASVHTHIKADITDFAHTHVAADLPAASATGSGVVELATSAEATTGTDTVRAVTPAGLKAVADTKAALAHTHAIADTTGLQAALDAKAASAHAHSIAEVTGLQTALDGKAASVHTHTTSNVTDLQPLLDGKAGVSHSHSVGDLATTGTADSTTFLRGDGAWVVPPSGGGGGTELTSYATQVASLSDYPASFPPSTHGHSISAVTGLQTALDGKAASAHTHAQADITGLVAALAVLSNEVEYNGTSWPARPAISGIVKYLSTKHVAAGPPPDRLTGDLWFRHPDAT